MHHLSQEQINMLKTLLVDEKKDLENRISDNEHFGLGESMRDESGELSPIDNHPGDLATEMYEREKDIALLERSEIQLERIDAALDHMSEGTYGICVTCHNPIPYDRLLAMPSTMYCKEHCPQTIVSERRPIEEQFLAPPFGRTSLDEHESQNGFDGEDAWQIVEHWGTSNTPAMAEIPNPEGYDAMEMEAGDDLDGFVEPYESFVATDMFGKNVTVVRNRQYRKYIEDHEGDPLLEPDKHYD
ncbi:TraR/DksA C4-type zinc finger protein [Paenibacillus sediminis]|uniref:YteA family regulatory protein n=1 Tax=Paenibacillus sediminis TaxID=664909 RepID=A0ABS4GYY0_9BACL|nr:TraR/DksA C4-type zinc finger protein [Paenibacillus sediminis]MBP1935473.1 YteA family regulatory protein [Paenibacillus sediminis]